MRIFYEFCFVHQKKNAISIFFSALYRQLLRKMNYFNSDPGSTNSETNSVKSKSKRKSNSNVSNVSNALSSTN